MAFTPEGERLIGDAAKNQLTANPTNTVFDAKRLIGREWTDKSVQHDIKYFPFKVIEKSKKPHVVVDVKGEMKSFAAEEISAMVLSKMKVNFYVKSPDIRKLLTFLMYRWNLDICVNQGRMLVPSLFALIVIFLQYPTEYIWHLEINIFQNIASEALSYGVDFFLCFHMAKEVIFQGII